MIITFGMITVTGFVQASDHVNTILSPGLIIMTLAGAIATLATYIALLHSRHSNKIEKLMTDAHDVVKENSRVISTHTDFLKEFIHQNQERK